ncbi:hypothetical protein MASR2M39_07470 [Ignavibacteriales bacterium]
MVEILIKDNSLFNVKSYDNSNVYVERDYTEVKKDTSLFNIYSDSTSMIYTDYYLDDPPSGSIQSGLASKTTMKIDAEWMPPSQGNITSGGQSNLLRAAIRQIRKGHMTAARAILLPLLNNPENMQMSCEALEIYGKTYNPETMIKFSLKERRNVTLDVYNIAGQKVVPIQSGSLVRWRKDFTKKGLTEQNSLQEFTFSV